MIFRRAWSLCVSRSHAAPLPPGAAFHPEMSSLPAAPKKRSISAYEQLRSRAT